MNLIVSYPRSGNTWVRYCIEYLTGKATTGYIGSTPFDEPILNSGKFILYRKRHCFSTENMALVNRVIFLLRNPKECIPRDYNNEKDILYELTNRDAKRMPDGYLHLLQQFKAFPKDKVLLYYEDLMENKFETYTSLASYLGTDLSDLYSNIQHHKQRCLEKTRYPSQTRGQQLVHHSKKLDKITDNLIRLIIRNYPELIRYI